MTSYQDLAERAKVSLDLPTKLEFLKSDDTDASEVEGGNLNDVVRIVSRKDPSKSVILKHAPLCTKFFGPNYPLSTDRNDVEYKALRRYNEICPGLVPEPYCSNENENFFIMEDLRGFKDLQVEIIRGNVDERVFTSIAHFLLRVHQSTHRKHLSRESFAAMMEYFRNDDMVGLIDQYFFTRPFTRDDPTNKCSEAVEHLLPLIYEDQSLLERVKSLRERYLTRKECLLHADLHTGSVMMDGPSTKIIDAEFATVGPAGFDLGMLIANYIFSYYAHLHYPLKESASFHETVWEAIRNTIEHYLAGMSSMLDQTEMEGLIEDSTGFIGCELIRRIIGAPYVSELENRPLSEIACLKLGLKLLSGKESPTCLRTFITYLKIDENNIC